MVQVCRQSVCATSIPSEDPNASTISFEGDLEGVTLDLEPSSASSTHAVLTVVEPPSLLADGDVYSLALIEDEPYSSR